MQNGGSGGNGLLSAGSRFVSMRCGEHCDDARGDDCQSPCGDRRSCDQGAAKERDGVHGDRRKTRERGYLHASWVAPCVNQRGGSVPYPSSFTKRSTSGPVAAAM